MGLSKTCDHIKIKIKMPNPSQEPPASSKAPNEDLKDMYVLCTFKLKIERQNSDHGHIILNIGESKTSNSIKIKWRYHTSSQEPKVFSKVPDQDWKDIEGLPPPLGLREGAKIKNFGDSKPVTLSKLNQRFHILVMNPKLLVKPISRLKGHGCF